MSVTYDRSVVFSGYSGFLHQLHWPPRYNWNIVESGFNPYSHNPYSWVPQKLVAIFTLGTLQDWLCNQTLPLQTLRMPQGIRILGYIYIRGTNEQCKYIIHYFICNNDNYMITDHKSSLWRVLSFVKSHLKFHRKISFGTW